MTSKSTRKIVIGVPIVAATWAALLAAPSSPTAAAADGMPAQGPSTTTAEPVDPVAVADAVANLITPTPAAEAADDVERDDAEAPTGSGRVAVSDVAIVVNDDGSAALAASFVGGAGEMALKSVHIETAAGPVDVASTLMWLPIFPGIESRAGGASDAGGFVVPEGLTPGQAVQVQFQFDDDTCVVAETQAMRRDSSHDQIFPVTGDPLGPGLPTSAMSDCVGA